MYSSFSIIASKSLFQLFNELVAADIVLKLVIPERLLDRFHSLLHDHHSRFAMSAPISVFCWHMHFCQVAKVENTL